MEPKFKVGDLIKNKYTDGEYKILAITSKNYIILSLTFNEEYLSKIELTENHYKILPKEVKITREELAEAWDEVAPAHHYAPSKDSRMFKVLVNKLGL